MHTSLRSCLTRIFQQPNSSALVLPEYLAPSAACWAPYLHTSPIRRPTNVRWATSDAAIGHPSARDCIAQKTISSDKAHELAGALRGSGTEADAWLALLEANLPPELESSPPSPGSKLISKSAIPIPRILSEARRQHNIDLLSYLGVGLGRWKVVLWVVQTLKEVSPRPGLNNLEGLRSPISWTNHLLLDDATDSPACGDPEVQSKNIANGQSLSLDDLTRDRVPSDRFPSDAARVLALRQIWQSTGSMILEANRYPEDKAKAIMSHVYQIIAHLHHIGAVPDSMYNYPPADDPSVTERPPTLYLLCARILATLSDAVWRAREKDVTLEAAVKGAEYSYEGFELPTARYKLKVRELEPAVWLDFVLWACVESGYIREGTWILNEMKKGEYEHPWSTIDWDAVQPLSGATTAKPGKRSPIGGFVVAMDGYSHEKPLAEIGSRTISREVVVATIDGMLSTVRTGFSSEGESADKIQDDIDSLREILELDGLGLTRGTRHGITLRLAESLAMDPEGDGTALERIVALAPSSLRKHEIENVGADRDSIPPIPEDMPEDSAIALGLLHRALHAFALQHNHVRAHRVFAQIESLVKDNKRNLSQDLLGLQHYNRAQKEVVKAVDQSVISDFVELFPNIPVVVLVSFFDLIIDAKAYGFGRWLLYSRGRGGLDARLLASPLLAPALLRFAAATSDSYLLKKVSDALVPPLSEQTLRALFQCQVTSRNWDGAEELMKYFKDHSEVRWSAAEATELAHAVMKMEQTTKVNISGSDSHARTQSFHRGRDILETLLRGNFNATSAASQRPDFTQVRLLSQLTRIFKSVPGVLEEICQGLPTRKDELFHSVNIPAPAFNILLDSVVKTRGSTEGKHMWKLWCEDPTIPGKGRKPDGDTSKVEQAQSVNSALPGEVDWTEQGHPEKVVIPNLTTLRIIIQAAVQEWSGATGVASDHLDRSAQVNAANGEAADTLEWATHTLRKFGHSEREIDAELAGYLSKKEKVPVEKGRARKWKIRSVATTTTRYLVRKIRFSDSHQRRIICTKGQQNNTART